MGEPAKKLEAVPTTIEVKQPNQLQLTEQTNKLVEAANAITISDHQSLQRAADYLAENKAEQKRMEEERKDLVGPLNETVRKINAKYKPFTEALQRAEQIIKGKIGTYDREQERIRQRELAEAEAKARRERERLEARAETAREKGNEEKAETLAMQAASTVAAVPAETTPKVSGASTRKVWKADVQDVRKVCQLIAEGKLPPTLVEFKQVELNKIASTWQNTQEFPGLRIYQDYSVASRAR